MKHTIDFQTLLSDLESVQMSRIGQTQMLARRMKFICTSKAYFKRVASPMRWS